MGLVQNTNHKQGHFPLCILIFKSSTCLLPSARKAGLYIQIRCRKVGREVSVYQQTNITVCNARSRSIVTKVPNHRNAVW
jgi:hypothetical protein